MAQLLVDVRTHATWDAVRAVGRRMAGVRPQALLSRALRHGAIYVGRFVVLLCERNEQNASSARES